MLVPTFLVSSSIRYWACSRLEGFARLICGREVSTPVASMAICLSCQVSQWSSATSLATALALREPFGFQRRPWSRIMADEPRAGRGKAARPQQGRAARSIVGPPACEMPEHAGRHPGRSQRAAGHPRNARFPDAHRPPAAGHWLAAGPAATGRRLRAPGSYRGAMSFRPQSLRCWNSWTKVSAMVPGQGATRSRQLRKQPGCRADQVGVALRGQRDNDRDPAAIGSAAQLW